MKIKIVFRSLIAISLIFSTSLFSQSQECNLETSIDHSTILANIQSRCCGKAKPKKLLKCLKGQRNKIKKTRTVFSKAWAKEASLRVKNIIDNGCQDESTFAQCTDESSLTLDEMKNQISSTCCGKRLQEDRLSCLVNQRRKAKLARKATGRAFFRETKKVISDLNSSRVCGAGGEEPSNNCSSLRDAFDGANNFLYKPVSEGNGAPAILLPPSISSGSCSLTTANGDEIQRLSYVGRTNGNRETYRTTRFCSNFPNSMIVNCSNGRHCWSINGNCTRQD